MYVYLIERMNDEKKIHVRMDFNLCESIKVDLALKKNVILLNIKRT